MKKEKNETSIINFLAAGEKESEIHARLSCKCHQHINRNATDFSIGWRT